MDYILSFIVAVMAGVACHYITIRIFDAPRCYAAIVISIRRSPEICKQVSGSLALISSSNG